ncbi:MAG: hypothetical protein P4L92_13110 [Rudaea sp.]|nr:hypothetical protein [Rudaea sp.]
MQDNGGGNGSHDRANGKFQDKLRAYRRHENLVGEMMVQGSLSDHKASLRFPARTDFVKVAMHPPQSAQKFTRYTNTPGQVADYSGLKKTFDIGFCLA